MTAYLTLRCENEQPGPGGDVDVCCSMIVAPADADAAAARAHAAAFGWSLDEHGRDLCGCQRPRPAVLLQASTVA